jgi:hypothetical protein
VDATNPEAVLPQPPDHVMSEVEQDRRLIRQMLAMTPDERLAALTRWARLAEVAEHDRPGS